jgi:hypothetical protein
VSAEIFVLKFVHGDAASLDQHGLEESLARFVIDGDLSGDFARVRFSDSTECEIIIGRDDGAVASVMLKRFEQGDIVGVLFELMRAQEAVVLTSDGVAVLPLASLVGELPQELRDTSIVASNAMDVGQVIYG